MNASGRSCLPGLALFSLVIAAIPESASAEIVTHQLTAIVSRVQPAGTSIQVGQPAVLRFEVERSTPGFPLHPGQMYAQSVVSLALTIGSETAILGTNQASQLRIIDNLVYVWAAPAWYYIDHLDLWVSGITEGSLAWAESELRLELDSYSNDGTPFVDLSIPQALALTDFDAVSLQVTFIEAGSGQPGTIDFQVNGLAVPVRPTTWGRVKAQYSR